MGFVWSGISNAIQAITIWIAPTPMIRRIVIFALALFHWMYYDYVLTNKMLEGYGSVLFIDEHRMVTSSSFLHLCAQVDHQIVYQHSVMFFFNNFTECCAVKQSIISILDNRRLDLSAFINHNNQDENQDMPNMSRAVKFLANEGYAMGGQSVLNSEKQQHH